MESKREQALVGLFVLVAAGLLIVTVFLLSGRLGRGDIPYRAYFKNAGGLAPGSEVRYAGGPPVGRVQKVPAIRRIPRAWKWIFRSQPDVPVKTDSTATITSTSPLGDNFLGIMPGTAAAPKRRRRRDAEIERIHQLRRPRGDHQRPGPERQRPDHEFERPRGGAEGYARPRERSAERQESRQYLREPRQRPRHAGENRPVIHAAIANLNDATTKVTPLLDDFRKTSAQANDTLAHLDATITEDRPDLRQAIANLRQIAGFRRTC